MSDIYRPEGALLETAQNRAQLSSLAALERAMQTGAIVEGTVTLCDERLALHVDLGCAEGIIEAQEAMLCREGESRKDIAIITRVGKSVACKILAIEPYRGGVRVRLSRRAAQQACFEEYLSGLRAGDVIDARVTHMEPFGAFVDIGCGVSSLLSVDCISVSRISHPRDRLSCGMPLRVVVRSVDLPSQRIYVTLRELLGTWEENAAAFEVGQTVTGILRSIEPYGVFVELAPNLAGLAEVSPELAAQLKNYVGKYVAVYIKSILPERMKIKLVLIDHTCLPPPTPQPLRFFLPTQTQHISSWRYSPIHCHKRVETVFT